MRRRLAAALALLALGAAPRPALAQLAWAAGDALYAGAAEEARLGALRLHSAFAVDAELGAGLRDSGRHGLEVSAGPTLALRHEWELRLALEGAAELEDGALLAGEAGVRLALERSEGLLRALELHVAREEIAEPLYGADGWRAGAGARLGAEGLLGEGDWIALDAGLALRRGAPAWHRYREASLALAYGRPLGRAWSLRVDLEGRLRRYAAGWQGLGPDRRDAFLYGGASLTRWAFLSEGTALELRLDLERNASNDPFERYGGAELLLRLSRSF